MMSIQEKIVDTSFMTLLSRHHPEMELVRSYEGNSLAFFGLFQQNLHFLITHEIYRNRKETATKRA